MPTESKDVIQDALWLEYTYKIIGLAMEAHNELGPGRREPVYHNAMAAKCEKADLSFEDEPFIPVTLDMAQSSGAIALTWWSNRWSSLNSKPART